MPELHFITVVPCQVTLAKMERHTHLFSASLTTSSIFPTPRISLIPSMCLNRCLPGAVLPSIIPKRQSLSKPSPLRTCPKNPSCLIFTTSHNSLALPALRSTSCFVTLSTHGTLIILLINHISAASSLFFISLLIFQLSQPYSITDQM